MRTLWQGVECWLVQHFSEATHLATPFREPIFDDQDYQEFLRRLGYAPVAQAAFGKPILPEGREQ